MSDLAHPSIDVQIVPRVRDLGGFQVRRVLPSSRRKMVGPFIFLDQMGPAILQPGEGIDVRPHPHIGLATVTYLSAGEILHRDSVGSVVTIRPGDVNWMTAGKGIAHSERTPGCARRRAAASAAFNCGWPCRGRRGDDAGLRASRPGRAADGRGGGLRVRVVAGSFLGKTSPVSLLWETLLADVSLAAGRGPAGARRITTSGPSSSPTAAGRDRRPAARTRGRLYVLKPGVPVEVRAVTPATLVLLGGEPMDGPRHIWWNFVSSSEERIEQARADWQAGRFKPIPGETERIDAPERG